MHILYKAMQQLVPLPAARDIIRKQLCIALDHLVSTHTCHSAKVLSIDPVLSPYTDSQATRLEFASWIGCQGEVVDRGQDGEHSVAPWGTLQCKAMQSAGAQ